MFKNAVKGNIICVLPTGSGKTLISVMLALYKKKQLPNKQMFFIVNTVNLVRQQAEKFKDESGGRLKVALVHGEDINWNVTQGADIVMITHAVLRQMLEQNHVSVKDCSLWIFDEAHHTKGNHEYNKLMRDWYFTTKLEDRPKILGLSASPGAADTVKGTLKKLAAVSGNMNCVIKIVNLVSLRQWVSIPDPSILTAKLNNVEKSYLTPFVNYVRQIIEILNEDCKYTRLSVSSNLEDLCTQIKDLPSPEDNLTKGVWELLKKCLSAYQEQLDTGRCGAIPVLRQALENLKQNWRCFGEKEVVGTKLMTQFTRSFSLLLDESQEVTFSPKTRYLLEVLSQHKDEKDIRILVFVEKRTSAKILKEYIVDHELGRFFKSDIFVGHGKAMSARHHEMIVRQKIAEQAEVEKKFRKGDINLLIATSVAEEGLDIRECNLVIRYDRCTHVTSFIQSRGRARRANSKFLIIRTEVDKVIEKINSLKKQEQTMMYCLKGLEGVFWASTKFQYNPVSEEAQRKFLTDDAPLILEQYCLEKSKTLPSYNSNGSEWDGYVGYVMLPPGCPFTGWVEGASTRASKKKAEHLAAYEACVRLHKMHELDTLLGPLFTLKVERPSPNTNTLSTIQPKNALTRLNEYCQRNRHKIDWKDGTTSGPSHLPTHTVILKIDGKEVARDSASKKDEAKQKAAATFLQQHSAR